jgi:tetratricopeptide (TPR) repeat protein
VLLLGRLYERLGDLRSAEGVYRQALATGPSAPEVAERLAHLLIRQGRPAEAIEILPSISPVRRSYVLEQAGDQSRAIEYLQGRIERDLARTDAEARVQLARLLYERTKDAQRALFHLDEAMAIDPNSHTQAATRALILSGQGRGVDALQVLNDYVAKHDTFRAYWMRGAYLAEQGELERAEEDYRKLATRADSGAAGCELLAGFYAEHGKLDQAIQTADEGTRAYPDNLRLKYRQMQLLLQRGQPPDGEKAREIRTVLQRELPNSAELMQYEALEKLANPTPEALAEARQILERVVQLNPLAVNAHLVLIDVLIRQRELQAASAQAVRALAANPKSRPLQVARAKVELTLGYGRAAFQLADQVLADDPNNAAALLTAVNGALASKDRRLWEQARTQIEAAAGRIPDKERLLARARVYLALGQPERAIPELDAYCRTEPGSTSLPALVTLADLYRSAGDLDRADKTVARAQALAPDSQIVIHARFLLRLAQNRLADLAGISAAYISAREQDPTIVVSAASRLMSLPTKDHRQQALQLFEHGVTRWPRSLETRLGLGLALYTAGEAERARQIYETLLQEFPSNPQVLNDLAWILQEHKQDYAKALELADQGVRLTLGNPDLLEKYMFLLDTRGTILMKMSNRWNEARQDLEKLVRLAPADSPRMARTLLKLGQVCLQLKDPRQAKEHLTRALEIDGRLGVFTAEERAHISQMLQERSGAE